MKAFVDKNLPYIAGAFIGALACRYHWNFPAARDSPGVKEAILGASLGWAAIATGFYANIMATIMGGGAYSILERLSKINKLNCLFSRLFSGMMFCILLATIDILLFFVDTNKIRWFFWVWSLCITITLVYFISTGRILLEILRAIYAPRNQRRNAEQIEEDEEIDPIQ